MNTRSMSLLLCTAALLAACGGGGGGTVETPVPTPVDPDAMAAMPAGDVATVRTMHTTLGRMAADDRANPLALDAITPPTSDSDEPLALE